MLLANCKIFQEKLTRFSLHFFKACLKYSNKRKMKIPEKISRVQWSFWCETNLIQASTIGSYFLNGCTLWSRLFCWRFERLLIINIESLQFYRLLTSVTNKDHWHFGLSLSSLFNITCGAKGRDCGSTVVKVLCYKSEGRWFDSRLCHWHKIPLIALWPWGWLSL